MHRTIKKTLRIDTDIEAELERYDEICNDPLNTVIREKWEKLKEIEYSEEGKIAHSRERLVIILTYERKELL